MSPFQYIVVRILHRATVDSILPGMPVVGHTYRNVLMLADNLANPKH